MMSAIEKFLDMKELQKKISEIEIKTLSEKTKALLQDALDKMPAQDRELLMNWAEQVEMVRDDGKASHQDKEARIQELETSRVVSEFLNRMAHSMFDRSFEGTETQKKSLFEAGLATLGVWKAGLNPELSAVGYFALKRILPGFLLSEPGGNFLKSLKEALRTKLSDGNRDGSDASKSHSKE